MHELAISENILKVIIPAAEEGGAKRILKVRMHVGEVSGVIPSLLEKSFAVAAEGTIAEGAELVCNIAPTVVHCSDCGAEGETDKETRACKKCGSLNVKIVSGREYFIEDLEVE